MMIVARDHCAWFIRIFNRRYSHQFSYSYTELDGLEAAELTTEYTRTSSSQPSLTAFFTPARQLASSVKHPDMFAWTSVDLSVGVCFGFHFSCRRTFKRDGVPRIVWFTTARRVCIVWVCVVDCLMDWSVCIYNKYAVLTITSHRAASTKPVCFMYCRVDRVTEYLFLKVLWQSFKCFKIHISVN